MAFPYSADVSTPQLCRVETFYKAARRHRYDNDTIATANIKINWERTLVQISPFLKLRIEN